MTHQSLDPERIIQTLARLERRMTERFPGRGICEVCRDLGEIARRDGDRAWRLGRANIGLRLAVGLVILIALGAIGYGLWLYRAPAVEDEAFHVFQGIEAGINILILTGAGIWFLLNLETRIRRRRVLDDLHELRSIAHVIDMYQLTKDPVAERVGGDGRTASSPVRDMSAFELSRYLDYCTEMLSLTGKLAALYLQSSRDTAIIQAVNEIEDLTANLTRKIWQKITLLRQVEAEAHRRSQPGGGHKSEWPGPTPRHSANDTCSPLHPFALGADDKEDA